MLETLKSIVGGNCRGRQVVIHKRNGWHTFRHTFGTLLKANGEDVKTVQELLRHANSRITLEVYTQEEAQQKQAVQSKVVRMMIPHLAQEEEAAEKQKEGLSVADPI